MEHSLLGDRGEHSFRRRFGKRARGRRFLLFVGGMLIFGLMEYGTTSAQTKCTTDDVMARVKERSRPVQEEVAAEIGKLLGMFHFEGEFP